jgi:hypothetical protein
MTTVYEHRSNMSKQISTKRPILVLCCVLFMLALLPFVVGLQAVEQVVQPIVSSQDSATFIYDSGCNPFGALLSCVEVQSENSTLFH